MKSEMNLALADKIKMHLREIQDFPVKGINFKDITPLLSLPALCSEIVDGFEAIYDGEEIDAIAGIEARGFIFGSILANRLKVPFIPIRKEGKLPYKTIVQNYGLEYGKSSLEMHLDSVQKNWNVIVHDDLLATGGTAEAAAKMITSLGANIHSFSFLLELNFLEGRKILEPICNSGVYSLLACD